MTRALMLAAAAAAALTLAACNKNQASNTNSPSDTANSAVTGQSTATNNIENGTAAAVGTTSAATMGSMDTGAFVSNAAQSDMYEIQAAKMAEQKSKDPDVKKFAKQMVTDHTKLSNEMKPLIKAAGQTPPADLDARRKGMLQNLGAAAGAGFDKAYMDEQVAAHQEALTLMQGYADHGSDQGLKGAAAKAVPIVQHHLDMAKQIQAKMGGGGAATNSQ